MTGPSGVYRSTSEDSICPNTRRCTAPTPRIRALGTDRRLRITGTLAREFSGQPTLTEIAMRKMLWTLFVPLAAIATACGRNRAPAVDDALKNDLALASQAQPYNAQQVISPTEAGYAAQQKQL